METLPALALTNQSILDEILNSSITENSLTKDSNKGTNNAVAVRKNSYKQLVAFKNVTSYSMQESLLACPREFQLNKLRASLDSADHVEEDNVHFAFGHAVGAGVATYDETHDLQKAIWAAFLAWNIDLFAAVEPKPRYPDPKKSFHHAVWALETYAVFVQEETDLSDYEVVQTEASVAIDFENGHYYVGHIDELLRNKFTRAYRVKENKTTSASAVDPATYQNSDQALSYSVVVDSVGASEYEVLYTIYSSTEQRWLQMSFVKSPLSKAQWIQTQYFRQSDIELYSDNNFFPKHGSNCVRFGRRCQHFGECDFSSQRVYGKTFKELPLCTSFNDLEEIEHYHFKLKISQILQHQQEKLNALASE